MSVATSIDALAVGASFAVRPADGILVMPYGILICAAVIGCVTFLCCLTGVLIGGKSQRLFGKKAEIAGGAVLIILGLKILLEHLLAGN
jgi:putative Mn2+ efflux pump MntP